MQLLPPCLVVSDHIIFKVTCGEKSYLCIRMFRSTSLKAFSKLLWPEKLFSEIYSNVSHGSSAQLSDTGKIFIVFCQLALLLFRTIKKNCRILFTSAFNWHKLTGSGEAQFSWKGSLFVCFSFIFLSAFSRLLFGCFTFHCCSKWKVNSKLKAAESARGLF